MDELNKLILKGFFVKATKIVKEKAVYIVATDRGTKIIKKSFDSREHIMFQHAIKEHLYHAGFLTTDRFYMSVQNKPYFYLDDNVYTMTDYIGNKISDFSDNNSFKSIIERVAQMHKLSKNAVFNNTTIFYSETNLLQKYKKNTTELMNIKKNLSSKNRLSDFDVLFLKNYDYYLQQIKSATDSLEKTDYYKAKDAAVKENRIAHNLLKEENIFPIDDKIFITNFSGIAVDLPLMDLVGIILRYIKKRPEDYVNMGELLTIYSRHSPLSNADIEILYYLLKAPNKFIKICNMYYLKKRTWTPNALINRMREIIEQKELFETYLEELKNNF